MEHQIAPLEGTQAATSLNPKTQPQSWRSHANELDLRVQRMSHTPLLSPFFLQPCGREAASG